MRLRILALFALVFAALASPANASVTITFYSHNFRLMASGLATYFPHGFVTLSGTDAQGASVEENFGFSAKNFFPNVLFMSVEGTLDEKPLPNGYVEESNKHFSFVLSEAQYRAVLGVAEKWRTWPQPSYDIDEHNCVHFVMDMASAAGLAISTDKKFTRDPKGFLEDTGVRNAAFLSGAAPAASPAPFVPATPPVTPPTGGSEALRQRLQELREDVARERAN